MCAYVFVCAQVRVCARLRLYWHRKPVYSAAKTLSRVAAVFHKSNEKVIGQPPLQSSLGWWFCFLCCIITETSQSCWQVFFSFSVVTIPRSKCLIKDFLTLCDPNVNLNDSFWTHHYSRPNDYVWRRGLCFLVIIIISSILIVLWQ